MWVSEGTSRVQSHHPPFPRSLGRRLTPSGKSTHSYGDPDRPGGRVSVRRSGVKSLGRIYILVELSTCRCVNVFRG